MSGEKLSLYTSIAVNKRPRTDNESVLTEKITLITNKQISTGKLADFAQLVNDMGVCGIVIGDNRIALKADQVKVLNGNNEVAMFEGGKLNANFIDAQTIVVNGLRAGDIDAENATISNLVISGSSRSPFVGVGGNIEFPKFNDNISVITNDKNGPSTLYINIKKDKTALKQIGRVIHFVQYEWNGYSQKEEVYINVPTSSGYESVWLFEDGLKKKQIRLHRQCVTLLGLGDDKEFYGWLVLGKVDTSVSNPLGRNRRTLAYGKVTGTSDGVSIAYRTFDDSTISVSRIREGRYSIHLKVGWATSADKLFVNLTSLLGLSGSSVTLVTIEKVIDGFNIIVLVSTGAGVCDGSFNFEISNMNDFDW